MWFAEYRETIFLFFCFFFKCFLNISGLSLPGKAAGDWDNMWVVPNTVLYCIIPDYIVLYCTLMAVQWCIALVGYSSVVRWLYCTVPKCTILSSTKLNCTLLYYTESYFTVLYRVVVSGNFRLPRRRPESYFRMSNVYCIHCTVYSTVYTVYTVLCSVYTVLYTVYTVLYTVNLTFSILYCIRYSEHDVYSTVYTLYTLLYTVQYTLYCILLY